jgi:hypothetical protein
VSTCLSRKEWSDEPNRIALIEVFPVCNSSIGLDWVLVCFAALCLVAFDFVFRFLPETKGPSVEEVVREFEREAQGKSSPTEASASDQEGAPHKE